MSETNGLPTQDQVTLNALHYAVDTDAELTLFGKRYVPARDGVQLTSDEASACAWALDHLVAKHNYDALRSRDGSRVDLRALAARLEEAVQ